MKSTRGNKLDTANEEELWSGRVWTGRQAAKLGLVDSVGSMESVCKQKFGDKVGLCCRASHTPLRLDHNVHCVRLFRRCCCFG